jgi:hypothetical protein
MLSLIFLIAALVLFILAAIGVPAIPPRLNLVAAGLACMVAAQLVSGYMK